MELNDELTLVVMLVSGADITHFKDMVKENKVPSMDRVVYLEMASKYSEGDIRSFFPELRVERVKILQNGTKAFVKFFSMESVENAIQTINKHFRIYRASEKQLRNSDRPDFICPSIRSTSLSEMQILPTQSIGNASNSQDMTKILKIRGLPWTASKDYVLTLFPGKFSLSFPIKY